MDDLKDKEVTIQILVNRKPVVVHQKKMSGLQIKEAAIAQGVAIRTDFVLFELLKNGQQKVVRDDQETHLEENDSFEAIPNDDNS